LKTHLGKEGEAFAQDIERKFKSKIARSVL